MTTPLMLEYSSCVHGASCWAASCAFSLSIQNFQTQSYSNNSCAAGCHKKASEKSLEPSMVSVTFGKVTRKTAGEVLGFSSFCGEVFEVQLLFLESQLGVGFDGE